MNDTWNNRTGENRRLKNEKRENKRRYEKQSRINKFVCWLLKEINYVFTSEGFEKRRRKLSPGVYLSACDLEERERGSSKKVFGEKEKFNRQMYTNSQWYAHWFQIFRNVIVTSNARYVLGNAVTGCAEFLDDIPGAQKLFVDQFVVFFVVVSVTHFTKGEERVEGEKCY